MKKIILMMALAIASVSVSAQKSKSAETLQVTTTPQMHCANCEKKIKTNIRFVKGVKKIETSIPNQTVTIVYEPSKSNFEDFVKAFKKIGYKIEKVKQAK